MQRVLVIGNCGSGKSTASLLLARRLDLPLIHLDREFWRPGWVEPSTSEWDMRTRELVQGERWLIDGNYSNSLEQRLARADTVVWLDFPRLFCLGQVLRRVRLFHGKTRADCGEGCPERFDLAFLKWVWDYPSRSRSRTLELKKQYPGLDWQVFHTRRELYQWIEGIEEQ